MERFIFELSKLLSVLLAAVLGFAIGFERKLRFKEAGVKTHTIVCIGAALMMVVSKYAFQGMSADVSRVAAQIVSGVGFLGAGIIMFRGQKMHGLTTAAGVWATAGVGMACGGELWIVAVGATVILIGVQCLMHSRFRAFRTKKYCSVIIHFKNEENAAVRIKEIFRVDRFKQLVIERKEDALYYSAVLTTDQELTSLQLDAIMCEHAFISSIERCDDE
ncbi:MAG: MgtC/SapB family protein [Clostridia bacterium]|nr:MgtC/SapB family protein [Clostridia bacterium]